VVLDLKANVENAIAFYRTAYERDPAKAVELCVGDDYIQHNPIVANGKQPFIEYFTQMARDYADKSITFVRAVAEEDMVDLHTHQVWPGNDQYLIMDFFASIRRVKSLSTGMLFSKYQQIQRIQILCIGLVESKMIRGKAISTPPKARDLLLLTLQEPSNSISSLFSWLRIYFHHSPV